MIHINVLIEKYIKMISNDAARIGSEKTMRSSNFDKEERWINV